MSGLLAYMRKKPIRSSAGVASVIAAALVMSGDNDYRRAVAAQALPWHAMHFNRSQVCLCLPLVAVSARVNAYSCKLKANRGQSLRL